MVKKHKKKLQRHTEIYTKQKTKANFCCHYSSKLEIWTSKQCSEYLLPNSNISNWDEPAHLQISVTVDSFKILGFFPTQMKDKELMSLSKEQEKTI